MKVILMIVKNELKFDVSTLLIVKIGSSLIMHRNSRRFRQFVVLFTFCGISTYTLYDLLPICTANAYPPFGFAPNSLAKIVISLSNILSNENVLSPVTSSVRKNWLPEMFSDFSSEPLL